MHPSKHAMPTASALAPAVLHRPRRVHRAVPATTPAAIELTASDPIRQLRTSPSSRQSSNKILSPHTTQLTTRPPSCQPPSSRPHPPPPSRPSFPRRCPRTTISNNNNPSSTTLWSTTGSLPRACCTTASDGPSTPPATTRPAAQTHCACTNSSSGIATRAAGPCLSASMSPRSWRRRRVRPARR
ncbi:hypothetical protein DFJ73DRAFT_839013 [Zopfochytrium polystomum]|nr:hypothetical protein DFJ73DRAFT_839013 [Zopfochytrium polystomum]